MDFSGNNSINNELGHPLLQHDNHLPVTVFLDEELQLEPLQERHLNPYIWKFFEPHVKSASLIFTALKGTVFTATPTQHYVFLRATAISLLPG